MRDCQVAAKNIYECTSQSVPVEDSFFVSKVEAPVLSTVLEETNICKILLKILIFDSVYQLLTIYGALSG